MANSQTEVAIEREFKLTYRDGYKPPQEKIFRFAGDLKAATERARKHCVLMGYVYIYTAPFVVDLDAQEKNVPPQLEERV